MQFREYSNQWPGEVKLFEAYMQRRQVDEGRLQEAGITFDEAISSDDEVLRESGTTSDFATYLDDKITKRLMWAYREETSNWRRYSRIYNVPDFKPINFVRVSEMEDLLPVPEGGEYHDSQIEQIVGPSCSVETFGREFSLSRRALINDDLNQLRDRPAAFGRSAARTLSKDIWRAIRANPHAYDGDAVFSAEHGNLLSEALEEESLAQAVIKMRIQKEFSGNRIGLRPKLSVIPAELEMTIRRILNSTTVPQPAGSEGVDGTTIEHGKGGDNVLAAITDYVVEDYLEDANDWYTFADPQLAPVMGVGFLNGIETPDIFLKDPGMRNVLGGSDPYTGKYDEIWWKIRYEWGTALLDWRGATFASVA
jgi:hypothetical protein